MVKMSKLAELRLAIKAATAPAVYQSAFGWGFVGCESDSYESQAIAQIWADESVHDAKMALRELCLEMLPLLMDAVDMLADQVARDDDGNVGFWDEDGLFYPNEKLYAIFN